MLGIDGEGLLETSQADVSGRRLPLRERPRKLAGVVDVELSQAVVAYIRGAGRPYPHDDLDAVARVLGTDAAARLRPRLEQLVAEAVYWPVDWGQHDLDSASRLVQEGMVSRHPELSDEAITALMWEFDYSHF
jgi:hypothetical protein